MRPRGGLLDRRWAIDRVGIGTGTTLTAEAAGREVDGTLSHMSESVITSDRSSAESTKLFWQPFSRSLPVSWLPFWRHTHNGTEVALGRTPGLRSTSGVPDPRICRGRPW